MTEQFFPNPNVGCLSVKMEGPKINIRAHGIPETGFYRHDASATSKEDGKRFFYILVFREPRR